MKTKNAVVTGLLIGAAFLSGCASDGDGPDLTGMMTESSKEGRTVAELVDCDESDAEIYPYQGPSFDENGELVGELPGDHIVATTAGWAREDEEIQEMLIERNNILIGDVLSRDGLLGVSFLQSDKCGASRTLSIWRDEQALFAFVLGDLHAEAMGMVDAVAYGWETTHWTADATSVAPTFDDARKNLNKQREAWGEE